jgi:hypothetical protein
VVPFLPVGTPDDGVLTADFLADLKELCSPSRGSADPLGVDFDTDGRLANFSGLARSERFVGVMWIFPGLVENGPSPLFVSDE